MSITYRFVIEGEVSVPPPGYLHTLEDRLRDEVKFALGPYFDVVLSEIVDWCRECGEPWESDEGCDACIKHKSVPMTYKTGE